MKYSAEEVIQYIKEENVKFIRLSFCDIFGRQKNISIMPSEIHRAFSEGIVIDASSIKGFEDPDNFDLYLHPDASTLSYLPWRPEHGKVVRMFCDIKYSNGEPYEKDCRAILKKAVAHAKDLGYEFSFGPQMEFYLFNLDEEGNPTNQLCDDATYMDIAPYDRGENVRREICLTLEKMGILPESSHHEAGPGQNEIDFRYSDALSAADNAITYYSVVKTISAGNGFYANFWPQPLPDKPGNGLHINISVEPSDASLKKKHAEGQEIEIATAMMIAGILEKIEDITFFLNSKKESYDRLGKNNAPKYISWAQGSRSQLIRVPESKKTHHRAVLRSADSSANPYITFALLIYAGLYGLENKLTLPAPVDVNLSTANSNQVANLKALPGDLQKAKHLAFASDFVNEHLPKKLLNAYFKQGLYD